MAALHRLRAGLLRRLPGDLERQPRAAHAADGVTNAISGIIVLGALLQVGSGNWLVVSLAGAVDPDRHDQHLRRLPGHPPHARHVPEVVRRRPMSFGLVSAVLSGGRHPVHPRRSAACRARRSAKRAIWYGIVGMALAVVATVFGPGVGNYCRHRGRCWSSAAAIGWYRGQTGRR